MSADGRLVSIEYVEANADIARRILDHAGVGDRVTIVVGSLADDGTNAATLEREHGFAPGTVDFVFIDHDKDLYLPDLERIVGRGWLHQGSVVVADNVKFPAPPALAST